MFLDERRQQGARRGVEGELSTSPENLPAIRSSSTRISTCFLLFMIVFFSTHGRRSDGRRYCADKHTPSQCSIEESLHGCFSHCMRPPLLSISVHESCLLSCVPRSLLHPPLDACSPNPKLYHKTRKMRCFLKSRVASCVLSESPCCHCPPSKIEPQSCLVRKLCAPSFSRVLV
jgi:hypothetical protein